MYLCTADCGSRSHHREARFHCSARSFATRVGPSTRRATPRRPSAVRRPVSTARPSVDCEDRPAPWKDHAVERWIGLDRAEERSIEVRRLNHNMWSDYSSQLHTIMASHNCPPNAKFDKPRIADIVTYFSF